MTQITYIAGGVPRDEIRDRAYEVKPAPYFNPMLMTEGGAYLTLMRDQVSVLSQYFPDRQLYKKGLALIDNAMYHGVHGPMPYMGAVEPTLYPVMRAIDAFKSLRMPATRINGGSGMGAASWTDESLVSGPAGGKKGKKNAGIGVDEIPIITQEFALWWWLNDQAWLKSHGITSAQMVKYAVKAAEKGAPSKELSPRMKEWNQKFDLQKFIIDTYNQTIDKFAHHPLYNFLPQRNSYPSSVVTKNILHAAGVQALAQTGEFSSQNMSLWVRNGILRSNIAGDVGALSPEKTAFILSGLPDSEYANFVGDTSKKVDRPGAQIGIVPAVAVAIIGLVSAAVAGGLQLLNTIQMRKAAALGSVQGWGTQAYAANQADWGGYQQGPAGPGGTTSTDITSNMPLLLGAAAGLYLLTQK